MDEDDDLARHSNVMGNVPLSTEYFGFAFYLMASVCLIAYILWAFLPKSWLDSAHIYYYPSRWWAVAVPAFVLMLMIYIYVALAGYNTEVLTYPPTSIETITDLDAKVDQHYLFTESPAVRDLPLHKVCQVLYEK